MTAHDMEFPGNCLTNVLKIENHSTINYWVYTVSLDTSPQRIKAENDSRIDIFPATPPSQLPNDVADRYSKELLRKAERLCRDRRVHAVSRLEKLELWLFEPAEGSAIGQGKGAEDPSKVNINVVATEGLKFQKTSSGIFRSSMLERKMPIPTPRKTPTSGSFEPSVRSAQSINAKTALASSALGTHSSTSASAVTVTHDASGKTQQQEDQSLLPYHLFIISVLSTISYRLTKYHGYVPLNIRTLVPPRSFRNSSEDSIHDLVPCSLPSNASPMLMALDARLTTTGTLLITSYTTLEIALTLILSPVPDQLDRPAQPHEADVWLAPSGTVARYLEPETVSSEWDDDEAFSLEEERERARDRLVRKEIESRWKSDVIDWISDKGLDTMDWEASGGWIRVQIWATDFANGSKQEEESKHSQPDRISLMSILWPAALSFRRARLGDQMECLPGISNDRPERLDERQTPREDGDPSGFSGLFSSGHISPAVLNMGNPTEKSLAWFLPLSDTGVEDPLAFAERWYSDKKQRDEKLAAKRKLHEAEEAREALRIQEANKAIAAEADRLRREAEKHDRAVGASVRKMSTTGELQPVGGVYPTPPDGVHPQGPASVPSVGPGSVQANGVLNEAADGSFSGPIGQSEQNGMDVDLWGPEDGDNNAVGGTRKESMISDLGITGSGLNPGNQADVTGLGGGFGLDDDDMFGDDEDPDFSFFDAPDLGGSKNQDLSLDGDHDNDGIGIDVEMGDGVKITDSDQMLGLISGITMADTAGHPGLEHFIDTGTNPDDFDIDEMMKDVTSNQIDIDQNEDTKTQEANGMRNTPGEGSTDRLNNGDGVRIQNVMSPPLSPDVIRKKLLPNSESNSEPIDILDQKAAAISETKISEHGSDRRRHSLFGPVRFNPTLDDSDHKYMSEGRFWFASAERSDIPDKPEVGKGSKVESIPLIGLPKRKRKNTTDTVTSQQNDALPVSEGNDIPPPSCDGNHRSEIGHEEEKEESSESDVSDDDSTENETPKKLPAGVKRKREIEDDGDLDMASSLSRLAFDHVSEKERLDDLAPPPWDCLASEASDWPLTGVFSTKENTSEGILRLSGMEFMGVGQILADQLISGTLSPLSTFHKLSNNVGEDNSLSVQRSLDETNTAEVVMETFTGAVQCTLNAYAIVEDAPPETPLVGRGTMRPIPQPKRTNSSQKGEIVGLSPANSHIFKIPPPHIQVQRADNSLEVLPPALQFWETFSFGPCSGDKDVISFCIHPPGEGVPDAAAVFLDRIGSVYESCRLGAHIRGETEKFKGGMVPISFIEPATTRVDVDTAVMALKDVCVQLGASLAKIPAEMQNIVIYLINPFVHANALVDLCSAFSELFHTYICTAEVQQSRTFNEVILQIVPMDFISSRTSIVAPSQLQYTKLALEVYERCAQTDPDRIDVFPPTAHAPSILLAQPPPKSIDFKLTSEPSPSLLRENSVLHVAYSQSIDERWVSVAWTDNRGDIQSSVSYCLGRKNTDTLRPFEEVAKEIWETTLEITETRRVHWRLMFVKAGVMGREEADIWTSLSSQPTNTLTTLTLIAVDTSPALSLHSALPPFAPSTFNPQAAMYTTPVSTPQPNTQSPDQFSTTATPATPGGVVSAPTPNAANATADPLDLDLDATLVDVSDETWGVILSHRLQDSLSLTKFQPALASGYLIKRTGASEHEDPPTAMSVNLLHAQRSYEPLLREILNMYRDLSTLARLKGATHPVKSVAPWHVAAAVKAQEGLSFLM